jgi:hypothetical protein
MERVGAPPGAIEAYAALVRETFPVLDVRGAVVATASSAGVPASWAAVPKTPLHPFSDSPLTTLRKLEEADRTTLLFLVPQHVLASEPVSVRIGSENHRLTELDEDAGHDIAMMYVTVSGDEAGRVGAPNLIWPTGPNAAHVEWPLVLVRRDPRTVSSSAFALGSGFAGAGPGDGDLHLELPPAAAGGPVIALGSGPGVLIGFATGTSDPAHFVGTARVAQFAHQVILAATPAQQGAPTLGIRVETASVARRHGAFAGQGAGAVVTAVLPRMSRPELRTGDLITAYDGAQVSYASQLVTRVRLGTAGTVHQLTVRTLSGHTRILQVVLAREG